MRPGGPPAVRRRERARNPRQYAAMVAHFDGSRAGARALIDGDFVYVRFAATKPSSAVAAIGAERDIIG